MIKKESAAKTAKSVKAAKSTKGTKGEKATKAEKTTKVTRATKSVKAKSTKEINITEDEQLVEIIANAILDKKGQNVISLDLRELGSSICDFFVICNADSTTNVSAIADNVEDELWKVKKKLLRTQGKENSFWVIQDYGNIVVHIFQTQYRDFYRLEELWSDCKVRKF